MKINTIINDDCLHAMQGLDENSIDSIVTDPPYGLSFMGKNWDHGIPGVVFWQEALRVAKPGCHLLAFGGTRTFHRLAVAIEDAGWEIRDTVMWVYGSGFPKSLNIGKAIDKQAGAERVKFPNPLAAKQTASIATNDYGDYQATTHITPIPATPEARQWEGYGTALKPAWEPVIVARKPIEGTVANNVLKWGTGGINIDGCRVGTSVDMNPNDFDDSKRKSPKFSGTFNGGKTGQYRNGTGVIPQGRFPANLIHDGSDEVVSGFPNDTSRFFYCAKASKSERGEGNNHPTVKPLALMRYLVRLVTPPDGVVLDPFCGSGSTLVGALQEGFRYIGIDKEPEYVAITEARIRWVLTKTKRMSVKSTEEETESGISKKGFFF